MEDRANILVIDDEVGPRESLRMILKPYYNVYTADRGVQAIEIVHQMPIDLVTVDLKMPGLPGTKVLEKIKQHDPEIEAIILTGYGSMDTAIEGLRLGAFDYIAKPFDVNHILALVRRALERRHARLKLREVKSEFMANISHELRTPLSVVIGFVSILLDQLIGNLTEEQRRVLEKIYKNSGELLELIDNILILTSLNAGELPFFEEEFDVGMVINQSIKRYEQLLEEKGISLFIDMPPAEIRIFNDRNKIGRIVQNLVHNAIKFTPRGKITIRVLRLPQQERVGLEIIDTGLGIPENQVERMFQPFQQMDGSLRREFSGLGLGLTVAHRLADFVGASLEIQSQAGLGTHVLFSIPYRSARHNGGVSSRSH